jgi:hypothetical protein
MTGLLLKGKDLHYANNLFTIITAKIYNIRQKSSVMLPDFLYKEWEF